MTPQSAQRLLDTLLTAYAAAQHGVVAWWQLRDAGVPRDAFQARVARGGLHRMHRGVYAVGHRCLTREGHRMAAVLAVGPSAFLSHRSAAEHLGLLDPFGAAVFHVAVPSRDRPKSRRGIVAHRLPSAESFLFNGIPTTTVPQTLLDVAATSRREVLRHALKSADRLRVLDMNEVARVLDTRRAGVARLREALLTFDGAPTRSALEARFLDLCRTHGIPRPQVNVHVLGHLVDFLWPAERLIVETDGDWHATRPGMEDDRDRDGDHALGGYRTLRFTWRQVTRRPDFVVRVLRSVLAERAALGA